MKCFVEEYEKMKRLRIDNEVIKLYFKHVHAIVREKLNRRCLEIQ